MELLLRGNILSCRYRIHVCDRAFFANMSISNLQGGKANHLKGMKYFVTVCLSLAFCALGVAVGIIGPTLRTLAYNIGVCLDELSFIFVARGSGYLFGSILSGIVFGKLNPNALICASLCVTAVGLTAVPFMPYVVLVALSLSAAGISMGFLDTGGNVMCLKTWGEKSGPYMQILHFSFALGATLAPLLSQPFIMDTPQNCTFTSSQNSTSLSSTSTPVRGTTEVLETPDMKFPFVAWAFLISSGFCILVALLFCYIAWSWSNAVPSDQKNTSIEEGQNFRMKMLGLLFIFYLLYVGTEVTFGSYIYSFATISENHYSKEEASFLNTLFWGTFAIGRFLSIFVSIWVTPNRLLQMDLVGTLTASVIMTCFPLYAENSGFLLWIAVALYGLSMANIFPSGISWVEQYITVTEKAASVLVVGAALGEMLFPLLLGQLIEANAMILPYFTAASTVACILNYILMLWVAKSRGKRLNKTAKFEVVEKTGDYGENSSLMNDYKTEEGL